MLVVSLLDLVCHKTACGIHEFLEVLLFRHAFGGAV